jgi:hypothetical protein
VVKCILFDDDRFIMIQNTGCRESCSLSANAMFASTYSLYTSLSDRPIHKCVEIAHKCAEITHKCAEITHKCVEITHKYVEITHTCVDLDWFGCRAQVNAGKAIIWISHSPEQVQEPVP